MGGGAIVNETNGGILSFVEEHNPSAPLTIYESKDNGKAWSAMDFVIKPDTNGNVPSMHMNEAGITLRHGKHAGRLIRAARHYAGRNSRDKWPEHYTTAIYTDDDGKTWNTSKPFAEKGTGEAAIAELSDGRLYYNSRAYWNKGKPPLCRRCAYSTDGGETWPLKRLVYEGSFAYSSLAAGRPNTPSKGWIYLLFESDGAKLARFNLSWLLEGEKTDDEIPDWLSQ